MIKRLEERQGERYSDEVQLFPLLFVLDKKLKRKIVFKG